MRNHIVCFLICWFTSYNVVQAQADTMYNKEIFGDEEEVVTYTDQPKPGSEHNIRSEKAGYTLLDILPSPCDQSLAGKPVKERIVRNEYRNDTLEVEVAFNATCCISFLGEIEVVNDTILNLMFTEYGEQCFCSCCYYLTYVIHTDSNKIRAFQLNNNFIEKSDQILKAEYYKLNYHENGKIKTRSYYLDDQIIRELHYNDSGKLIQYILYVNGEKIVRKYD